MIANKELKDFLIKKAIHCKSNKEQMCILHLWYGHFNDDLIRLFFDEEQFTDNMEVKHGQKA